MHPDQPPWQHPHLYGDEENWPDEAGSAGGLMDPAESHALGLEQLRPQDFIRHVVERVRQLAARGHRTLNTQTRGRLAKFWYGDDPAIHYELALHEREGKLEVGLHMESDPQTNLALYQAFDRCLVEIHSRLGSSLWLEEWDRGWTRLYETWPLHPLHAERVEDTAARIWALIAVLQPIYETVAQKLSLPS